MGRHRTTIRAFEVVISLMTALGLVSKLDAACGPPTIDEVLEAFRKCERDVFEAKSFYVKYERDEVVNFLDPESGGLLPAQWTQAFFRDKWYSERRFTQPGMVDRPTGARTEIPALPSIQVLKHGIVLEWDQSSQPVIIGKFNERANLYSGLNYTRNVALDAPKYIAKAGSVDLAAMRKANPDNTDHLFLPDFLSENWKEYTVSNQQADINGVQCWILEWPGMDRIAVDAKRGFAIIRRSFTWGPGKPLRMEISNSDHRQVKPGLWLPFQQHETRFANIAMQSEDRWGKPESQSRYRVQAMRFDDLDDTFFQISLPPKTKVFDAVRDFHYEAGDNLDPFQKAIDSAIVQQQAASASNSRRMWFGVGVTALVFVLGTACTCKYWARRGQHVNDSRNSHR